jgi:hypothetical protein
LQRKPVITFFVVTSLRCKSSVFPSDFISARGGINFETAYTTNTTAGKLFSQEYNWGYAVEKVVNVVDHFYMPK